MGSKHQLTEPAEETFESSAKHQSTVPTVGPPKSLFLALLAFRLLNSLAVQTYFNPDEFWQGPEVAHRMVFGYGYLTWEWQPEWAARSFLHPLLFAAGYRLLALLRCDTPWLVRHSPRFMQAAMAALADLRLYALTQRLFPSHPSAAAWALLCNLTCGFLLFCATRTFSNSLEASLAVIALSYWPWRHCQGDTEGAQDTGEGTQGRTEAAKGRGAEQGRGGVQLSATALVTDLGGANRPLALALAAAACMVRPTSTPFWLPLGLHELALLLLEGTLKGGRDSSRGRWERVRLLLLEVLPIGLIAVAITVAVDSWQYGQPMVFTPLNLLRFNVHLKGSSLYGSNPWHWYWSQGLIAMHGTFFPLACLGLLWCSFHPSAPSDSPPRYTHLHHLHHLLQHLQQGLVWWSVRLPFLLALWLPLFYSLSDHKEHRFILLSLPLLNTYAALALSLLNEEREREHSRLATTCNNCNTSNTKPHTPGQSPPLHQASNSLKPPEPSQLPNPSQRSTSSRSGPADQSWRAFLSPFLHPQSPLFRLLLTAAFLPQLLAALYLSTTHQRGTISVMPFLEGEINGILQTHSTPSRDVGRGGGIEGEGGGNEGGEGVREGRVEVLFLMPCHSTPFHSHLHNPAVTLTMLSCAPILTFPCAAIPPQLSLFSFARLPPTPTFPTLNHMYPSHPTTPLCNPFLSPHLFPSFRSPSLPPAHPNGTITMCREREFEAHPNGTITMFREREFQGLHVWCKGVSRPIPIPLPSLYTTSPSPFPSPPSTPHPHPHSPPLPLHHIPIPIPLPSLYTTSPSPFPSPPSTPHPHPHSPPLPLHHIPIPIPLPSLYTTSPSPFPSPPSTPHPHPHSPPLPLHHIPIPIPLPSLYTTSPSPFPSPPSTPHPHPHSPPLPLHHIPIPIPLPSLYTTSPSPFPSPPSTPHPHPHSPPLPLHHIPIPIPLPSLYTTSPSPFPSPPSTPHPHPHSPPLPLHHIPIPIPLPSLYTTSPSPFPSPPSTPHPHPHSPPLPLAHPNGTITMSREREFEDLLADPRDFLSSRYTVHTSVHACISGLGHGATAGAAAARPATAASAAAAAAAHSAAAPAAAHSATAASHCVYDATADFHAGTPATCRGSSSGTAEQGACMHGEHGHALADGHEHEHGGGGGEAAADVRACAGDFEQIEGRCLDGCYGVDGGGRPELPDLVVAFDTEEALLLPFLRCAGYTEVRAWLWKGATG
ncbi:unnamed protein product [Closterium sp. Naga37s-1]|nr:unnamed protein product [Closterium sp. Naga37s-1]